MANLFSPILVPLYIKDYPEMVNSSERDARLLRSLLHDDVMNYPGGIPNSLINSGEQWDFPNSWPPSVQMIIIGLANSNNSECKYEALVQGNINHSRSYNTVWHGSSLVVNQSRVKPQFFLFWRDNVLK